MANGFGSGFAGGPKRQSRSTSIGDLPRIPGLSRYQIASMKGGITEAESVRKALRELGQEDLMDEELNPEEGFLTKTFDLLGRPGRAALGYTYEIYRGSGDPAQALSEAAKQFVQSEDRKYKGLKSGSQLLTERLGDEATWGQAIAGFALDVAIDPLSYMPIAGWVGKAGRITSKTVAPRIAAAAMREDSRLGGIARAGIGLKDTLGTALSPGYKIRQAEFRPQGVQQFSDLSLLRRDRFSGDMFGGDFGITERGIKEGYTDQVARVFKKATEEEDAFGLAIQELTSGLTENELRLIALHAGKGRAELDRLLRDDYFVKALDQTVATGIKDPTRRQEVIRKATEVLDFFDEDIAKTDLEWGLLDEAQFKKFSKSQGGLGYVPLRTTAGQKITRKGVPKKSIYETKQPFQYERNYNTVEDALNAGLPDIELDIKKLMTMRSNESVKARTSRRLIDAVFKSDVAIDLASVAGENNRWAHVFPLIKKWKKTGGDPPEALQRVFEKGYDFRELNKGKGDWYMLPSAIVEDLEKGQRLFSNNESFDKLFTTIRDWQGLWKGGALFSLGYHMRNMWSNGFNNAVGGVYGGYARAAEIQRSVGEISAEFASGMPRRFRDIKNISDKQLRKNHKLYAEMRGLGVVGRGVIGVELGRDIQRYSIPGRILSTRVMAANRQMGQIMENNARIAHYVTKKEQILAKIEKDDILKNLSDTEKDAHAMQEAAASVKKYLFDYEDLTPFERDILKSVIPFYTWMRKNIPLQIESMFTKSLYKDRGLWYMQIPKIKNNLEQISQEFEGVYEPDYYEEMFATRLPIKKKGKATYLNPNLPFQDLNRMGWDDFVGSLTPAIKLPMELTGKRPYSYFLGREIERFPGEKDEVTSLTKRMRYALDTLAPPAARVLRGMERFKQGEEQFKDFLTSEVTGIKPISLDVEGRKRARIYAERDAARTAKAKLRQQLGER